MEKRSTTRQSAKLAFIFGVVFVSVILVIALLVPHPSSFQYTVFRIILALAAAGVAAEIPGILNVKIPKVLTASGALAVFSVVYFYSPAKLVVPSESADLTNKVASIKNDTALITNTVSSIQNDTAELKIILTEFVQRSAAKTSTGERGDPATRERAILTDLEKEYGLPAGTLTNQLPAFAKKLAADGTATKFERAEGAYAARDYAEAERFAIEAATEAKKALPLDKSKIIEALELAGWSASERNEHVKALSHFTEAATHTDKSSRPLEWCEIQRATAYTLCNLGDCAQAEILLRPVIKIRTEELGPEHLDTLKSRHNLAMVLRAQRKTAEAVEENRAVVAIRTRILGADHADTLHSRNNLGNALTENSNYAEAQAEHQAVLTIREHKFGAEHFDTLLSRHNLANVMMQQDRAKQAETEYRALLKIWGRTLGHEHPCTLTGRNSLANALQLQGRFAEAEAEYRGAIESRERVIGPEHPDTLISLYFLALCLEKQGKLEEARDYSKQAMERGRKVLEPDHPLRKRYERLYKELSGLKDPNDSVIEFITIGE